MACDDQEGVRPFVRGRVDRIIVVVLLGAPLLF